MPRTHPTYEEFRASHPPIAGGQKTLAEALAELDAEVEQIQRRKGTIPPDLKRRIDAIHADYAELKEHGGSRYVGDGADPDYVAHIAAGGDSHSWETRRGGDFRTGRKSLADDPDWKNRIRQPGGGTGASRGAFAKALLDIAQRRTEHMTPASQAKALAESTDVAGGFLLTAEIAQSVLMLIRNRVAVTKMPVTHVEPKSKQYLLPAINAGASASWLAENAAIPASAETFEIAATMVPRPLGALVAVSNLLLMNATSDNPLAAESAEDVIRADVADLMAVTYDAGLLQGDAAGPAPKGILRATGTTALPAGTIAANGSSPSYSILVAIVGALQQASMPFTSPGWIFSGRTLQSLMNLTTTYGTPLLAEANLLSVDASGSSGRLLGYPFAVTNAVPNNQTFGTANNASTIIFSSDWSELFVGDWAQLAMDASSEASYTTDGGTTWVSAYQSNQTVFKAVAWADMAIRRPAAFVLAGGILP